jgi:hypothetical protein
MLVREEVNRLITHLVSLSLSAKWYVGLVWTRIVLHEVGATDLVIW